MNPSPRLPWFVCAALMASIIMAVSTLSFHEARAQAQKPRMVVELFTSQGCSSCPPADRLMAEMARRPDVVVLSMPVDYWDYLGWKDTLAHSAFTARQKAYGTLRGDKQIYTPQAVVNGLAHAVGSDKPAIEAAAMATSAQPGTLAVPVGFSSTASGARVEVGPAGAGPRQGSVWLLPLLKSRAVSIGRGENNGVSVTYVNVVRGMIRLGAWEGTSVAFEIPKDQLETGGADSYAVVLQAGTDRKPGVILGAALAH
jgi:hypothetical protein